MSTEFQLPPDDEVRRAYKIPSGQDVRIEKAEALPAPSLLKKIGAVLEEAADFFGVPTFLLKKAGLVIAILFIPYWGPKVKEEVKSAVVITRDYWVGPFQNLPKPSTDYAFPHYVAVTNGPNTVSQNIAFFETGRLQTGTTFYPISGESV
jgi:hypothetical protein